MIINMPLANHPYDIILDQGAIEQLNTFINTYYANSKLYVITDETVLALHGKHLQRTLEKVIHFVTVKPGESSKSFGVYESVINQLIELDIKRGDLILAFGGGVIGDLAGFVSATLYRGIDYIQIPTTLLAQVDASIGGKTAINSQKGKNLVGAFYQPKLVIVDTDFLKTLPDLEFQNGMAEVIKSGLIGDNLLFEGVTSNMPILEMIERSINVKRTVVLLDEYDHKERMYLNFGHTFGHVIEKRSNYKVHHGFAVAEGMIIATNIGIELGITKPEVLNLLVKTLKLYHLGQLNSEPLPLIEDIFYDKKNIKGNLNMIFISEIGKPLIRQITKEEIYGCYHS